MRGRCLTFAGKQTLQLIFWQRNAKSVLDRVIWVEDTLPIVFAQVQHDVICMNSESKKKKNFFSFWVYEFQFSRRWMLKIQFDQTFIKLHEMSKFTMIFTVVESSKVLSLIILYQNQYCWFTMDSYIWVRFIKIKINIQSAVLIFCLFCYIWFCISNSIKFFFFFF